MRQIKKDTDSSDLISDIGTQRHFQWLKQIIGFILVLNVLDAVFTLYWINAGLAEEANVLLRYLVEHYPSLFIIVKFSLVLAGSYILWRFRHNKYAVIGIFLAFIVYYALLIYHISYFSHLLSRQAFS